MEYSRKFAADLFGIKGELSIDYLIQESREGQYLSASLEIVQIGEYNKGNSVRLSAPEDIVISPSIISLSSQEEAFETEIYLPPDASTISVTIEGDESKEYHLDFADIHLLSLGNEIRRKDVFEKQEFRRQVKSFNGQENDIWSLINFAGELSKLTTFEIYLEILEIFVEEYPQIRNNISSVIETILKRMILGELGDGRHKIDDIASLEAVVEQFSQINPIVDVNPMKSLDYVIQDLDKRQQTDDIVQLVYDFNIVEIYPGILNDKLFYLLLAEEIVRQSQSGVQNLLDRYFEADREGSFDEEKFQEMLHVVSDKDVTELEDWYEIVSYARSDPNPESIKYMVANLLYYAATDFKNDDDYYHIAPRLFRGAGIWYRDLEIYLSQRCEFSYHNREGLHFYHRTQFVRASDHLSNAIAIAVNDAGEYEESHPEWLTMPIIYKSLADARQMTADGQRKDASELLKRRRTIFEDFDSIDDGGIEQILSALGGERFRILSDIFLENGEYEQAQEILGKAIGLFKRGGLNRVAENTIQKKREVAALLEEINGDFNAAARTHKQISENGGYSNKKQHIHSIRAEICQAKALTIEGKYNQALENIRQVNRRTDKLQYDALDLGILLQLLRSYEADEVTNATRTIEKLNNRRKEPNHPLRVDYDYTEIFVVVLALQRLKQAELPRDLLASLIEISINRSLTPSEGPRLVEDTHLSDISIERLWRERLPSLVLSRVEEIQLEKATAIGNHKSVTLLLAELLEFYLALLVEFHAKRYWGDNWRLELTNDDENEDNLSIGVLSRIFSSDAGSEMGRNTELKDIYFSEIDRYDNLTQMRNEFDHAYEGYVDDGTFELLREWVFKFLRVSVYDTPIVASVEHQNVTGIYSLQLHWWRGLRHILLETDADLEVGVYYYLSSDVIHNTADQVFYSVDKDDIVLVGDSRVKEQISELD